MKKHLFRTAFDIESVDRPADGKKTVNTKTGEKSVWEYNATGRDSVNKLTSRTEKDESGLIDSGYKDTGKMMTMRTQQIYIMI